MRVLFLCADFLWPPNGGGRVRALAQLRLLASLPEVDEVTLFTLSEEPIDTAMRDALAAAVPKTRVLEPVSHPIHLFRHPRSVPRVAWLRARGVPYLAGKWESDTIRDALERVLAAEPFDVVWLTSLGLARYLAIARRVRPDASIVLDGHNVESEIWRQFAAARTGIAGRVAQAEWRLATRFEREALRGADAVAAISLDDARAYRELAGVEATYVPQIVDLTRRRRSGVAAPRFCYVGTLSWRPNRRGLDWFCREVWPLVRARLPDATLDIAGSGLPKDAPEPAAWQVPGVRVLGFVPDLAPLYERSAALIAPHLEGTGVRMKLLEAFASGVPVVTTPAGAGGLAIEHGREALIAERPEVFADALVSLVDAPERQEHLRDAAYAYLERAHASETAREAMRAVLMRARATRVASATGLRSEDASDRADRRPLAFPDSHR